MYTLSCLRAVVFGAALLAGGVSGCGRSGAPCHDQSDCASGFACSGPNDPHVCGIAPRMDCSATSDCPAGEQCHAVSDACSASGIGSQCGAPCSGASCGVGFRCDAQGACEPVPCDEGFACTSDRRCDPTVAHAAGPVWGRTQGCVSVPCMADADCPSSMACVNGVCQTGSGHCVEDIAVP